MATINQTGLRRRAMFFKAASGGSGEVESQAIITAINGTDVTLTVPQEDTIKTMVSSFISSGIWEKSVAIYVPIYGTASSSKFNWKNPVDSDEAHRIVWGSFWTSFTGEATPNGANAGANSHIIPSAVLTENDTHLSYFSTSESTVGGVQIGAEFTGPPFLPAISMNIKDSNGLFVSTLNSWETGQELEVSNTSTIGFFVSNRTSSTVLNSWKDGVKLGTNTATSLRDVNLPNSLYINARNKGTGSITNRSDTSWKFISVGSGLTDAQVIALNTILTDNL